MDGNGQIVDAINRILGAALTSPNGEALGRVCLEVAEQVTGSAFGFIAEVGADGLLHDIALSDPGWDACRIDPPGGVRRLAGGFALHGIYGRVLLDGKGFFTNEPASHPDRVGTPSGHPPLSSFLGVPLVHDGRTTGMIAMGNRAGGYRPEHLRMLETLAPVVVHAYAWKRTGDALRRSEATLRAVTDTTEDAIYLKDRESRVMFANPATLRLLGKPAEAVVGRTDRDFYDDPALGAEILGHDREIMDTGVPRTFEETIETYRGLRVMQSSKVAWRDEQGNVIGTIGISRDITDQKRDKEALRESERRYRDLVEVSPEPIAVHADGRWLYANPATLRMFGAVTAEEFLGTPVMDRVAPADRERASARIRRLFDGVALAPPDDRAMIRLDGSRVYVEVTGISILYEGRPAVLVVMRDMTERKRVEEQLRGLTQRLTYHVDHSPLAVIEWGPDMRLSRWSGEAERLFGWTAEEVLGKRMEDIHWIHAEDVVQVGDVSADLVRGTDPHRFSANRNYRKDGSVVHCEWYNSSLVDESGRLQSILSLVLDVTERKRAEEALRQARDHLEERVAERTAEIEEQSLRLRELASELTMAEHRERQRLAKVLHDDVQQLLVAAKLHTGILTNRGQDPVQVAEARQVTELLDQALLVSRTLTTDLSPPVLYAGGLGPAIQWLARGLLEKHGLEVEVAFEASGEPGDEDVRVFLFEAIREVLFNVVKHSGISRARVQAGRCEDGHIRIVIADAGRGFDPQAPRSPNASGGFGLFSIRHRLQYMGGRMEVRSAPGAGTRVTLIAPKAPVRTPVVGPRIGEQDVVGAVAPPPIEGNRIRIVLADDHRVMRQGLASLLGIEPDIEIVGEASDGAEAVALARALRPHVVVMDVSMPGVNGIEATRQIVAELPGIRVIGLSMHEEGEMAAGMREAGAVGYVTKGGPSEALIAAIRAALGDPPGSGAGTPGAEADA